MLINVMLIVFSLLCCVNTVRVLFYPPFHVGQYAPFMLPVTLYSFVAIPLYWVGG